MGMLIARNRRLREEAERKAKAEAEAKSAKTEVVAEKKPRTKKSK